MIFLILSIITATAIYALFKGFARFGVNTMNAIVVNYYTAGIFGLWYAGNLDHTWQALISAPWLGWAALAGIMLITLFYIMAEVSQQFGVTVASVASKMSLIIPVAILIAIDATERLSLFKSMGIAAGILAVLLTAGRNKSEKDISSQWLLPLVLFAGSGGLDFLFAMVQKTYLATELDYKYFVPIPFLFAASLGSAALLIKKDSSGKKTFKKDLLGGFILGLVNYGSIYFLLRAFGSDLLDRSSAIPANNIGTVMLSTLTGVLLFKERLTRRNVGGVVLALLAIFFLTYFDQ